MQVGDIVRVVYKGRPVFEGTRDPHTGHVTSGGFRMDGTSPWEITWDSRTYKFNPGQDAFVPFEAVCLYFGDPRSSSAIRSEADERGQVAFIPDRPTEVRRLRTKYGNMYGDESRVEDYPLVEVFTLAGDKIITVLDDQVGETTTPATQTVRDQAEILRIIAEQQKTIEALATQAGINVQTQGVVDEPQVEPEPEPQPSYPPEDDSPIVSLTEQSTGERGGQPSGEPALDWSSLGST